MSGWVTFTWRSFRSRSASLVVYTKFSMRSADEGVQKHIWGRTNILNNSNQLFFGKRFIEQTSVINIPTLRNVCVTMWWETCWIIIHRVRTIHTWIGCIRYCVHHQCYTTSAYASATAYNQNLYIFVLRTCVRVKTNWVDYLPGTSDIT